MTGSAASKKHPIFEQLSLANIFHFGPPLDERERSFEPVSAAPTMWRPEVGATRPTRSADGAGGGLVGTAPIFQHGGLPPRIGGRRGLPRCNVRIAGGRPACPVGF